MRNKHTKSIAVHVVLMTTLVAVIVAVNPRPASADAPPERATVQERGDRGDRATAYNGAAERLRNAVAAGELTEEEATARLTGLRQELNRSGDDRDQPRVRDGELGEDILRELETIAALIGMEARTVMGELGAGKPIAEAAEAHGVDPQGIVDTLVADVQAEIDEKVANGSISAEKAAEWSAGIQERITNYVNGGSEE